MIWDSSSARLLIESTELRWWCWVQGQQDLPPELQAKLKAAQELAANLTKQSAMARPQQGAGPTGAAVNPEANAQLIAAAHAAASRIAQQVSCLACMPCHPAQVLDQHDTSNHHCLLLTG